MRGFGEATELKAPPSFWEEIKQLLAQPALQPQVPSPGGAAMQVFDLLTKGAGAAAGHALGEAPLMPESTSMAGQYLTPRTVAELATSMVPLGPAAATKPAQAVKKVNPLRQYKVPIAVMEKDQLKTLRRLTPAALERALGQKGVKNLPEDWVKSVHKYLIEKQPTHDMFASWDAPYSDVGWNVARAFNKKILPKGSPGGWVSVNKLRPPDTLVHEISHEGFQKILPTERRAFMLEYLRDYKFYDKAYGFSNAKQFNPNWPTKQYLNLYTDPNIAIKMEVFDRANEVFAMAAAERATQILRFKRSKAMPRKSVYVNLSPEARAIINKYVKATLIALGMNVPTEGEQDGDY